jgi:hypothetical protein
VGCFLILFALISARLALIIMWLFTDDLSRAYDSWIVPLIGFFLLPWTTFAYAGLWVTGSRGVNDFEWFLVIVAFLVDLSSMAGGGRARASRI